MQTKTISVFILFSLLSYTAFAKNKYQKNAITEKVEESLISPPKANEVCFSPNEHCDFKLIKFIGSATKSIDMAIYDINLEQLVHALLVKSKSIQVRIIVDQKQAKGHHSLVSLLLKAGANVRFGRQRSIFHNKFTIIDGLMVETGSFNYTHNASHNNNENQIYLDQPEVIARFKKRFDEIWAEAKIAK